jgi:hypothetical protein
MGNEHIGNLRERHVVLELETFETTYDSGSRTVTAYCVVQPESIALTEMPDIERLQRLHQAVIDAWNKKQYSTVEQGIEHLMGRFGGELDSFYEILTERMRDMKKENNDSTVTSQQ